MMIARKTAGNSWTLAFSVLTMGAVAGIVCIPQAAAADPDAAPTSKYHFDLTKGRGTPVCEAYLKRLNTTDYTTPPYCDIPEQTTVPGFTPLHRVALTAEEIAVILPRISIFSTTGQQQQGNKEQVANVMAHMGATAEDPLYPAKNLLQRGWKIWRYDPPVDIDNDGAPDNVLEWQAGQCGHPMQASTVETDGREPTLAYVLAPSNDLLDIPKTKAIFGKPSGGYPIGPTIGIFKYQNLFYIDTYLYNHPINDWGLLTQSRYKPEEANSLAVFLRQHGKTQQVCEYHMMER